MIRVAVAGAGAWGRNHIRSFAGLRSLRLTWIIEPDEERREASAEFAPAALRTADAEEALADPRLDALVVASPTPTHAPLAHAALRRRKHVLVEKPLADTADEAWSLVRHARRVERLLMVGHLLLYHPALRRLKSLLDTGRLGDPRYIYSQRTNIGRVRTDEGALTSLAPHDVSVMVHLLDAWPSAVIAHGCRYVQPTWEDVVFVSLFFPGGVVGHVHLSWLDALKVRRTSLVASKCMAVFDDMDPAGRLRLFDEPASLHPAGPASAGLGHGRSIRVQDREPLRLELEAFARAIRQGRPPLTPGEDGARVVRVLEAAQASVEAGGTRVPVRIR